jgi:hypothetical protein
MGNRLVFTAVAEDNSLQFGAQRYRFDGTKLDLGR